MHKFILALLSTIFIAASCNLADPFSITTGSRGVFKSEDGGESFRASNALEKKGNINNVSVNSLTFDPKNPEVIYLGSASGIYKTENGGQNWRYLLSGMSVADIAVELSKPTTVYAAGLSGNNGKIIKSVDGGVNWTDSYTEPSKAVSVTSLAVSNSVVIGGLASGEIIRSFDSGNTWQASRDFQNRIIKIKFNNLNTVYALARTSGFYKSTDSGNSWTLISSSLTTDNISTGQGSLPHVSLFHDFALDLRQTGVIYLAGEDGLFRTVNDGAAWNMLTLPVRDQALKVSAVAVNPGNSNNIFVSIGSTIFKSLNGAITWETNELRTEQAIRVVTIDPKERNIVYLGLGDKK